MPLSSYIMETIFYALWSLVFMVSFQNHVMVVLVTFSLALPLGLLTAPSVQASHTDCPTQWQGLGDRPYFGSEGSGQSRWFGDDPISTITYRLTSLVGNADLFVVRDTDDGCHEVCSRTGTSLQHSCTVQADELLIQVRCVSSATGGCVYILERV